MVHVTRRRVLAGLFGLAVVAFLLVKLVPSRGAPPIEIRSEGSDQGLARSVLASRLEKLFPKGNGRWQVHNSPAGDPGLRCVGLSGAYQSSRGRAVTASYLFAGWLEVRLADFVYKDAAAAQNASSAGSRAAELCRGEVVAEVLRRAGYVVAKPHVFPSTSVHIGDGGRSSRIEIPSRYGGRRYDWDLDSTAVRRGRIILVVGTLVAGPFQQANQRLARDLVPGSV